MTFHQDFPSSTGHGNSKKRERERERKHLLKNDLFWKLEIELKKYFKRQQKPASQTLKTNKSMKKLILILIVLAAITEGCKKYEDGPLFSLRSAQNRLYGLYDLTTYTVNGVDSFNSSIDSSYSIFDFFYNDVNGVNTCKIEGVKKIDNFNNYYLFWEWHFINKNKTLKISSSYKDGYSICSGPFGTNILPEWEILRLTNTEVNMKTNFNNKEYYIELKERKK